MPGEGGEDDRQCQVGRPALHPLARAPDANPEPDGDATDFAREDYVEAAWRVVERVLGTTLATDPRDIIQPAMARPISSGESSWTK